MRCSTSHRAVFGRRMITMKIAGYEIGPIECRGAFTADFVVPTTMPIQHLVTNMEIGRKKMDIRSGMRSKYMPLRFDPATGAHLTGGRYLFDTWDDLLGYVRVTSE